MPLKTRPVVSVAYVELVSLVSQFPGKKPNLEGLRELPGVMQKLSTRYILPNEERTQCKRSFGIPKHYFSMEQQQFFFGSSGEEDARPAKEKELSEGGSSGPSPFKSLEPAGRTESSALRPRKLFDPAASSTPTPESSAM